MKECLKKRGLDFRQAERIVQIGMNVRVCEGECMGHNPGDEILTLTRCHSYKKPLKGESLSVAELTT